MTISTKMRPTNYSQYPGSVVYQIESALDSLEWYIQNHVTLSIIQQIANTKKA